MASFWTTAHQAAALLPQTGRDRFVYLIQDFEPGFYAWSSRYALAAETLGLLFDAVINQGTRADFLFQSRLASSPTRYSGSWRTIRRCTPNFAATPAIRADTKLMLLTELLE